MEGGETRRARDRALPTVLLQYCIQAFQTQKLLRTCSSIFVSAVICIERCRSAQGKSHRARGRTHPKGSCVEQILAQELIVYALHANAAEAAAHQKARRRRAAENRHPRIAGTIAALRVIDHQPNRESIRRHRCVRGDQRRAGRTALVAPESRTAMWWVECSVKPQDSQAQARGSNACEMTRSERHSLGL